MPSKRVLKQKQEIIDWIIDTCKRYKTIAIANLESLPAKQLSEIRDKLRDKGLIKVTKKTIIIRALQESEKQGLNNISQLNNYIQGMPALVFSNYDAFSLVQFTKRNKSKAPIKAKQRTPEDIIIKAGPTSFSPGPIIGELGAFRVKTQVEAGKVLIKENTKIANAGDIIDQKLANILTRLGIEPISIGLNITACYESGEVIPADVLDIDIDKIKNNISECFLKTKTLAVSIGYVNKETIKELLRKAWLEAIGLAVETKIVNTNTVTMLLQKANEEVSFLENIIKNRIK